jgi:hypothetical protein
LTKLTDFYKQRAKKHWATDGDKNTRYFHMSVQKRRKKTELSPSTTHKVKPL